MSSQQSAAVAPQSTADRNVRRQWGKAFFFALTFCSTFVLVFAGWSTSSAHRALQGPPTVPPPAGLVFPHAVAAGDVTQNSAVLWTRSTVSTIVTFTYGVNLTNTISVARTVTDPLRPVTVTISGLLTDTQYVYHVRTVDTIEVTGTFRTAAAVGAQTGLRFGASGDWRGELAPYPAVRNAPQRDLDFFVALGDTIYADFPSPTVPVTQAKSLTQYRQKHAEVYSERHELNTLADLRRNTALFAVIDDHEVTNDFAGGAPVSSDARFTDTSGLINDSTLFEMGLQAFHEYNPIRHEFYGAVGGDGRMDNERKLYRYRTFGSDAALFVLDTRSFRDTPIPGLTPSQFSDPFAIFAFLNQLFTPGRTLLGSQQLADLKTNLLDAQQKGITWKFIAVPEPIQNLGPVNASDRFEGYAAERADLLKYIVDNKIENVVFVAADVHGTIVNNLTYQTAAGGAQQPTGAFEVTTGSVAFDAPFGPTVVALAAAGNLITPTTQALYASLPITGDLDSLPNDKDDFLKAFLNTRILSPLGYDPVGLAGSAINATLLQGDYMAVHTFGWTEFAIAKETQALLVTTYGIDPYTAAQLTANPTIITARAPRIVSQFRVTPAGAATGKSSIYLPIAVR
ncbi:MAG: phosphodiesterase [Caldilinea sp. CFX5]|nr:phosphodiesterase [Caldilinea sp. CFX5]